MFKVEVVTTVTTTPVASKNGDLPNIKPLKVNGEHTPTTPSEKTEKMANGKHHEKTPTVETPIKETTTTLATTKENGQEEKKEETNGDVSSPKTEMNGKHHSAVEEEKEAVATA